jgi:hypothetical protein
MMDWKRFTLGGWRQPRPQTSRDSRAPRATEAEELADTNVAPGMGGAGEFDDPCFMAQPTRMSLELDDALNVPVSFNEQTAAIVLERTQRAREYREREKRSIPPVYNFGSDNGNWSGGGADW